MIQIHVTVVSFFLVHAKPARHDGAQAVEVLK